MVWVPDSSTAGYLGPASSPDPLEGDAWVNFLHDVVAGVTGLPPKMVRPRWQTEPPNLPALTEDWVSIGISSASLDWQPAITHVGDGDGHDLFQREETSTLLCSFFGPNAQRFAALLCDGLMIDQNAAALRAADVAVVDTGEFTRAADMLHQQWVSRTDVPIQFRRTIVRHYPVLNLLRATGTITGNGPGPDTVESGWDTDEVPQP